MSFGKGCRSGSLPLAVIFAFGIFAAGAQQALAMPMLLGTTGYGSGASTLVEIDPGTGALVRTIGPVGYLVNGLTWDSTTGTLYGGTSYRDPSFNGLITIDMTTGAGTPAGAASWGWGQGSFVPVTNITVNSAGAMYGWTENSDDLVSIDKSTGVATVVGDSNLGTWQYGLSFDNSDVLYLVNGDGLYYTVNSSTGAVNYVNAIETIAHHGDFDPESGLYYGLTSTSTPRDLAVANLSLGSFSIQDLDAGLDNLHTLAFVEQGATPIPEPVTLSLLGFGLVGLGARLVSRRRKP